MAKVTVGRIFLEILRSNLINRGIDLVLDPIQNAFSDLFIGLDVDQDSLRGFLRILDDSIATFEANSPSSTPPQSLSFPTP